MSKVYRARIKQTFIIVRNHSQTEMKTGVSEAVLIHGWGGSASSLAGLEQALQAEFSVPVKTIELPGHGSNPLVVVFDLEKYGKYVLAQLAAINTNNRNSENTRKILLVGHSFGGKILLDLASRKLLPENTILVLIASSGLRPNYSTKQKVLKVLTAPGKVLKPGLKVLHLENFYNNTFRRVFYKYIVRARDYEKVATNPLKKATFLKIINSHLLEEKLALIPYPCLLIWGTEDTYTPVWMGRKLAKIIPQAKLTEVEGARHNLPLVDPATCLKIIKDYLAL